MQQLVINTFYGSVGNIAQNSENVNQHASVGMNAVELSQVVQTLAEHLHDLKLDPAQARRAEAQIAVIQAELGSEPNSNLIGQAGRTLRNITEGAIASLIAAGMQPQLWHMIQRALEGF